MDAHPDRRVFVLDSLSTGPEMRLLLERLFLIIDEDARGERTWSFDEICADVSAYRERTGLLFVLESLKNFAANGRVSPAVAKIAGVLGIRVVGKASDQGTLEPTNKCRGEAKSLNTLLTNLKHHGLVTGKVRIAHCFNESAARTLKSMLREAFGGRVHVRLYRCRGLCSFYAEQGGMLVGFEKF
jgi:fatty acid-binding protein DegV